MTDPTADPAAPLVCTSCGDETHWLSPRGLCDHCETQAERDDPTPAVPTPARPAEPVLGEEARESIKVAYEVWCEDNVRTDAQLAEYVAVALAPHVAALVAAAEQRGAAGELRTDLDLLEFVGCQFGPCPGPDVPPEDMLTCRVCWRIGELRALLDGPS